MSELGEADQPAPDDTGEIRTDLACQRCGYNLRGLNATGLCPECGTPISLSLRKDLLCYAEPEYVKGLARGCRRILTGVTMLLACIILVPLASAGVSSLRRDETMGALLAWLGVSLAIGAVLMGILGFVHGVWLITRPQPQVFTTLKRDTARRLVRIYLLVAIIGKALSYSIEALGPPPRVMAAVELLGIGISVFGVIGMAAYFMYLSKLCRRVSMTSRGRYSKMPGHAKALAYAFAFALGWLVFLSAVEAIWYWGPVLLDPTGPPGGPFAAPSPMLLGWQAVTWGCITGAASLALLILFLVAARLHYRLRAALTREAAQAVEHWDEASAEART